MRPDATSFPPDLGPATSTTVFDDTFGLRSSGVPARFDGLPEAEGFLAAGAPTLGAAGLSVAKQRTPEDERASEQEELQQQRRRGRRQRLQRIARQTGEERMSKGTIRTCSTHT